MLAQPRLCFLTGFPLLSYAPPFALLRWSRASTVVGGKFDECFAQPHGLPGSSYLTGSSILLWISCTWLLGLFQLHRNRYISTAWVILRSRGGMQGNNCLLDSLLLILLLWASGVMPVLLLA